MVDFPAAALDRVGEAFDGRFGIYVEELNSGLSFGYCDNESLRWAVSRSAHPRILGFITCEEACSFG